MFLISILILLIILIGGIYYITGLIPLIIFIALMCVLIIFLVGKNLIFRPKISNNIHEMTPEGISYRTFDKGSDITLFVSHGNSGNIDLLGNPFEELPYNVVLYDYFNYGSSRETFGGIYLMTENHLVTSGESVYNDLKNKGKLGKKIIFIGISLGSHPATILAGKHKDDDNIKSKLVLIVPFDRLSSVTPLGMWRLWGAFDNLHHGKNVEQQTILVKAQRDE